MTSLTEKRTERGGWERWEATHQSHVYMPLIKLEAHKGAVSSQRGGAVVMSNVCNYSLAPWRALLHRLVGQARHKRGKETTSRMSAHMHETTSH